MKKVIITTALIVAMMANCFAGLMGPKPPDGTPQAYGTIVGSVTVYSNSEPPTQKVLRESDEFKIEVYQVLTGGTARILTRTITNNDMTMFGFYEINILAGTLIETDITVLGVKNRATFVYTLQTGEVQESGIYLTRGFEKEIVWVKVAFNSFGYVENEKAKMLMDTFGNIEGGVGLSHAIKSLKTVSEIK